MDGHPSIYFNIKYFYRKVWLRNNGSTLVSQIVNSMLFTTIAFAGKYDFKTLVSIFGSSYLIYLVAAAIRRKSDLPHRPKAKQVSISAY